MSTKNITNRQASKSVRSRMIVPYGYKDDVTIKNKVLIRVENVSKVFKVGLIGRKKKVALKDISLNIQENKNLAILGANGAGKTTLIEIICGLNKQTSGTIQYDLGTPNYKNRIGVQFQESGYPTSLSVADVIKFVIKLYNLKKSDAELKNLMNVFGVSRIYRKNASSLSGGEAQRLNTMLALIHNPKVLVMDELSTGLDIKIRTTIKQFIKEFAKKNNITLVIISHDIEEIEYLADQIIFLKNGEKIIDLSKKEIIEHYGSIAELLNYYIE